ncbi:hypothetical protein BVX99_02750 [bacterium F16]|nr:hypothetical protein BVX99_02750 [bacterium F16]
MPILSSPIRTRGVRLGVARDPEEAKLPELLTKGMSYQVIAGQAGRKATFKLIRIPTEMKVGMIYPISIILDQSQLSLEHSKKGAR